MAYFIYLDIDMKCRLDFDRPTDSGSPVTSGHRAIPRWAWHIGGLWVGFHIIEGFLMIWSTYLYGLIVPLAIRSRVVKSDVLAPPGCRGHRPVANVRTSSRMQRLRDKTAFTGGSGKRFRLLGFYADDMDA